MSNINSNRVKRVLWVILLANLCVAALKIAVGYIIKSSSLTADGFHSLTDSSSNVVGLIGMYFASQPIDENHPYGHSKFETLAGLFIAIMLFLLGLRIIFSAFSNMFHPAAPVVTTASLIALLITLAINIFIAKYEYKEGKKLSSTILVSDSLHTKSDIFISIGVLFTLLCVKLGVPPIIDSIASLVVSIFIVHAAYEIFAETSGVLVDQAAVAQENVRDIIMSFPQVRDVHKIRSRGCEQNVYIDLHILVEPYMSIENSHTLMHEIEKKLCRDLKKSVQAYIHLEPYYEEASISTKNI